ncbi:unnamed protein product [Paramecium octaurelia]|uniref:Uncharacterized protein n=1 Tax=Paramecium octaurelia TaxID=43137 RepID=A0A8S1WLV5_PAROT|nr:unnamed protein product [Paramecium octaurelia]
MEDLQHFESSVKNVPDKPDDYSIYSMRGFIILQLALQVKSQIKQIELSHFSDIKSDIDANYKMVELQALCSVDSNPEICMGVSGRDNSTLIKHITNQGRLFENKLRPKFLRMYDFQWKQNCILQGNECLILQNCGQRKVKLKNTLQRHQTKFKTEKEVQSRKIYLSGQIMDLQQAIEYFDKKFKVYVEEKDQKQMEYRYSQSIEPDPLEKQ